MDIRDLEAVVAVAEELHFGRAAERLHISQPPLSKRIQRVEQDLGVALFGRSRHGVVVTAAGKEIVAHAARILTGAAQLAELSDGLRRGTAGTVSIAAVGSSFYQALPHLLRRFRAEHPDVRLTVSELESPDLVTALVAGRVDVGFLRPPVGHGLLTQTVWVEDLVVAVNAGNPLARRASVPLQDLVQEDIVLFDRNSGAGYWDRVAALFRSVNAPLEPVSVTDHVTTVLGLVALGIGTSIVPASAMSLALPGVRYLPLDTPAQLPLAVASLPGVTSPTVRAFLDALPATAVVHRP
jgi:DNA-binding transcriptional LysR family regulator